MRPLPRAAKEMLAAAKRKVPEWPTCFCILATTADLICQVMEEEQPDNTFLTYAAEALVSGHVE